MPQHVFNAKVLIEMGLGPVAVLQDIIKINLLMLTVLNVLSNVLIVLLPQLVQVVEEIEPLLIVPVLKQSMMMEVV